MQTSGKITKFLYKIMFSISAMSILILLIATASVSLVIKRIVLGLIIAAFIFINKHVGKYLNVKIDKIHLIIGIGVSILLGYNFYGTCIMSPGFNTITSSIKLDINYFLTVFCILMTIIAIPMSAVGVYYIEFLAKMGIEIVSNEQTDNTAVSKPKFFSAQKAFMILVLIYLIGISAIIRANFYYGDDMRRAAEGVKRWGGHGRILSNLFSTVIHMDNYLTDVSPLPQIISAVIAACAGIILLEVLYGRSCFTILEILAVVPLYINPYFLACIPYKYDSPYMSLSILGGVLPLLYRKMSTQIYICMSFIGTLIVCMSYQPACGIYPMLIILLVLTMWNSKVSYKEILSFIVKSLIGYCSGMIFFMAFIMTSVGGDDAYASNKVPGILKFIPNFADNILQYYKYVITDFKSWWLVVVILLFVAFIVSMGYMSKRKLLQSCLASVFALVCMCLLCFGMYPALEKTLLAPRAMYGFGVLLTILACTVIKNRNLILGKSLAVLLSWTFFVFAFTYGNVLSVQKEYVDYRYSFLIENLDDLGYLENDKVINLQIDGDIGWSPIIEAMPQNYQILNRLIPGTEGNYEFYNYYKLSNIVKNDEDDDLNLYNLPLLKDDIYQAIYGNDTSVLVILK